MPLGSGVHDIWTAPTMLVLQPLKVLQINVTFVAVRMIDVDPDLQGVRVSTGEVRPTALLEIVTFVLLETAIPMSVPAPVIMLLVDGDVGGAGQQDRG